MLVQGESDQQRHRVRRDQLVGLVGIREVQTVGHAPILATVARCGGTVHPFLRATVPERAAG
jgi:hypothetical protein